MSIKRGVVYYDQLSGTARTRKLVETLISAVKSLKKLCNELKSLKNGWKKGFDQLLGANSTRELVKIHNREAPCLIKGMSCTFHFLFVLKTSKNQPSFAKWIFKQKTKKLCFYFHQVIISLWMKECDWVGLGTLILIMGRTQRHKGIYCLILSKGKEVLPFYNSDLINF